MKIALVSLNQIWENKEANKEKCTNFILKAAKDNADLIIFPEMTLTGFSMNTKLTAENLEKSETLVFFKELAEKYKINIVFGFVTKKKDKSLNQAVFVSSSGKIVTIYSKLHPFSFSGEDKYFDSGNSIEMVESMGSKIGLTICYDLRFPELYQALSKESSIIINIANWPEKRVDHWNSLLKARAIENQVFMLGINRTGTDGNNITYVKSSQIIDPEGKLLSPIFSENEFDLYEIDAEKVKNTRTNFPVKNDRKTDFYKGIL